MEGVRFVRGNLGKKSLGGAALPADGKVDLSDAIGILGWLFLEQGQTVLDCEKAADTNDDGAIDIADAVYLLASLYLGGPDPAEPYPEAGLDSTPDDLECCR